jgi:hypothetical protein
VNAVFSLKDLTLFDEDKVLNFLLTATQGEEPVQQWYCDCCSRTLFCIAPKVIILDSMLTLDRIGVGVYSDELGFSGKQGYQVMDA